MSVGVWQTTNPRFEQVDTVIIGAGIIGAYLALRLAESQRPALILDARHAAGGATGRNAGMLLSGIAHSYLAAAQLYGRETTRALWNVTIANRERMVALATRFGTPVARTGSLVAALSPDEAVELEEAAAMMATDGFAATWHPQDPLSRGFFGAIHTQADGTIQPALLTQAMLRASGAELREACEVYALESREDGVAVHHRLGTVLAQRVILATNAWTPHLLPEFSGAIVPGRGQVLMTAPAPHLLSHAVYCGYGYVYFQQAADGRLILGGFRNLAIDEEQTYADHPTPPIQSALEGFLQRFFPELAETPIERRWSGTMAFTSDGLPLVGRLARDERVAFAVGFNGHGLGLGVMAAEDLLAELVGAESSGLFHASRLMDCA